MNMLAHLHRLISYDDWANREVLANLQGLDHPPERSVKLLAHIIGAERIWMERLMGERQKYRVWPESSLAQCQAELAQLPELWKSYLSSVTDEGLTHLVNYKNSKGESWASSAQDILVHVMMHSAYHRGQIAADVRAAGFTPAYTDFIHGVRQGLVE